MKRIFTLILAVLLAFSLMLIMSGCDIMNGTDGLEYYLLPDGTYGVTAGTALYLEDIEIPEKHNGKLVTRILPNAFSGAPYLKTITIPEGAKYFRVMWMNTTHSRYNEEIYNINKQYLLKLKTHTI